MTNLEKYGAIIAELINSGDKTSGISKEGYIAECPSLVYDCPGCIFFVEDDCVRNTEFYEWLGKDYNEPRLDLTVEEIEQCRAILNKVEQILKNEKG